ncbi:MAG: DUF445 domain-containing protein [Rhodospirillaceae bacterium]|nr:DUF445 domain-containing protein [Rhodospirillales bacterium]
MAPAPQISNRTDRAAELRRMKLIATSLLALMFAVFIVTTLVQDRWPALSYVRAFAEAAMVGAIADWFAVVALFRHPFGLPIPHTAIIPRNKDRIGESLGAFICNNFLAPDIVAAKLDSLDGAGRVAGWLSAPETSDMLARRATTFVPALLDALEDEHVRAFMRGAMSRGIASVQVAPLTARILSVLVAHGHHQALFDQGLEMAAGFLMRNEDHIRSKVADRSWKWLPRWVDHKLADKVMVGALETLGDLRAPDHPWREEFQAAIFRLMDHLAHDPDLIARGEAIKAEVLKNPLVEEYLDSLWGETKARLKDDMAAGEGVLRHGIERALAGLGTRLQADDRMRAVLNRWLRRAVERNIVPHRGEIGTFIASVVARWDVGTLVGKLELQVGKDLQYIRINGTVVGGLVGLCIHALSRALG